MLLAQNNVIYETGVMTTGGGACGSGGLMGSSSYGMEYFPPQTVYWNSYPVYICTDKTKKAIEVLKALQAEKVMECKSVNRFIELVEKIAGLL